MSLADRILGSFDKLASTAAPREGLPDSRYLACWSYSVTSASETTFSGRALSSRCPQPDLPSIPNMPGIPGTLLKPKVGSIVGVMFLDADPAQPRVVAWDQNTAELVTVDATTLLKLGPSAAAVEIAGGGPAVGRVNDLVSCGNLTAAGATFTLTDGNGAITTFLIASSSGTITITPTGAGSIGGKITTGSGKVTSG